VTVGVTKSDTLIFPAISSKISLRKQMNMPGLKLWLFGPLRVECDGVLIDIGRRKAVALLVYLAVTQQSHSRDALATLFWPEVDQSHARGTLRRVLSDLYKALGESWLETEGEIVALRTGPDLWEEFEAAITYARRWLSLDPLLEMSHRALMELYARTGQRSATLRQYQECEHLLEEELGIQPSAETTLLYDRMRHLTRPCTSPQVMSKTGSAGPLPTVWVEFTWPRGSDRQHCPISRQP
jgi:DNA-binding SARP family transcriptional activator